MPTLPMTAPHRRRPSATWLTASALAVAALAVPQGSTAQPTLELEQPAAGAGAADSVAVLALASWDDLIGKIDYLGGLVGQPQQGQAIEGMIGMFTGGQGLNGLDKTRPIGVLLRNGPGGQFVPVGCLPVTDLPALLAIAQPLGVMSEDAGGGVTKLSVPRQPEPLYIKDAGKWAFIAQSPDALDNPPADPAPLFAGLVKDYVLGGDVRVQNIPAMFREMAVGALEDGVAQGMEQNPGESDEQYEERKRLTEAQVAQLRRMIQETERLSIGLAIGGDNGGGVTLDLGAQAKAGSTLAEELQAGAGATTTLGGFDDPEATLRLAAHTQLSPEQIARQAAQTEAAFKVLKQQMVDAIDTAPNVPNEAVRQVLKDAATEAIEAYIETVKAGVADAVLTMDIKQDGFALLGGMLIKSPEKIESALKKLGALTEGSPDAPPINWDAESHAGVRFHTLAIPVPPVMPVVESMLGDELELAIGIGKQHVYFAAGEGWFASVTDAIDGSQPSGEPADKPVLMKIALGDIAGVVAQVPGQSQAPAQMLADALAQTPGSDHLTITAESTDTGGLYRIQIEEGIIKAAAEVAKLMGGGMMGPGGGGAPPF